MFANKPGSGEKIKCRAAITDGCGKIEIGEIEVEMPEADEVLVKIKAAGICHTDIDSLSWGKQMILGHEGAGIVVKIGKNVTSVSPDDEVILNWAIPCGDCYQCQEGNLHICENNSPVTGDSNGISGHSHYNGSLYKQKNISRSFNLGTLSEYALVKEAAVVKKDIQSLSFSSAALISCGVMTGYGSVVNAARVKTGSSVVVIGAGGVGLNVIQGARISGALKIIAIEINKDRFDLARKLGATHTILAQKDDVGLLNAANQVKEILGGRGADYSFECTAVPELGSAPLAMIRNEGTAVQVSGIEQEVLVDMNLFEWDKIYLNPLYGKCNPARDFKILMQLYAKKELFLDELVTKQYSLSETQEAFDDLSKGKNAKGVIVF